MKLVELRHNRVLIEFIGDEVRIHDPLLEKDLTKRGIVIPPMMRDQFNGKSVIHVSDPEFQKAFEEVYYTFVFKDKRVYKLIKE